MRTRRNFSSSYFTSLATCLRFWVASLASLLGIILSPALVAETIVLPDPLFTNQFTSVEAWVQLDTVQAIVLTQEEYTDFASSISNSCQDILNFSFPNIYRAIDDSLSRAEGYFDYYSTISGQHGRNWNAFRGQVLGEFESLREAIESEEVWTSYQLDFIQDVVASLDTNNRTNVITTVTFGQEYGRTLPGGGCECPDYRDYLLYLQSVLDDLYNIIHRWDLWLTSFRDGVLSEFTDDQAVGEAMALVLRSLSDLTEGSEGVLSLADSSMLEFGSRLTELLLTLSYVQLGDQSSLASHNVASNLYAHLIDGWAFPTNTSERPLWVTCDQSELATLLDDVLAQALLQVSVTNDLQVAVTNSLQVAVTNAVEVYVSVSNEISQINNNFTEIEDLSGRLQVEEVNEITDTIDDRTTLFDGWDLRIRQFPERFESLWDTVYTLPESVLIYDGFSALAPQGGFDDWGGTRRRARDNAGFESVLDVPSLELYIGPTADTASGRWIYRIAHACHNVSNVIWSLLFLAIVVKLFKIDIFLLRSSIFIFLAWLSCLGVGGMRRLSITEAMAESFDRIAKLFTSMFGDGDGDAA